MINLLVHPVALCEEVSFELSCMQLICIGNSVIFSDIWHKYHK